jgi:hypothetical protein
MVQETIENILVIAIFAGLIGWPIIRWIRRKVRARELAEKNARERAERERLEACGEVVRFFANQMGYVARQVISREELERRVDAGVAADDLCQEVTSRISEVPGVHLGRQVFADFEVPVVLPESYRDRHVYVVGKSGYGKSNLLRNLILQDMAAGHGVGVIAPEQETITEEILPFIPEDRIEEVIYFNPADQERPVVFNPLELDDEDNLDLRVDETFTILNRALGDCGPRSDQILRHSLYALTELPETTLLDIFPLLDRQDGSMRKRIIAESRDEQTVGFFRDVYPQMPVDAGLPVLNRIGGMIRHKPVRNCLCGTRSTLNIRDAVDGGKILLFNLSDGILGPRASQLLGQLIISKVQVAFMGRADAPKHKRRRFYLFVDEFQSFVGVASVSYELILSRARKYGLGLVLAHQQTGQIPLELLREVLGNVSTLVSFQVSQADATKLAKEFVTECDGEVIQAEPEELLRLRIGQALCRIGETSFMLKTELFDRKPDHALARRVIEASRQRYGSPQRESGRADLQQDLGKSSEDLPFKDLDPGEVF